MSHASLPRRPPRPRLPLPLTSATLASRSSSACLALVLIGVFAPLAASALGSTFGAGTALAAAPFFSLIGVGWRAGRCLRTARSLALRRLTTLAFFFAARTFLICLRFWTIHPPGNNCITTKNRTAHYMGPVKGLEVPLAAFCRPGSFPGRQSEHPST